MPDRRFEDTLSVEDLLKKPAKEIQIMTYLQAVKTNGTVTRHDKCINALEEDMKDKADKTDVDKVEKKGEGKIGTKGFYIVGTILGIILTYIAVINSLGGG